jgi:hypothetical protein
MGKMAKNCLFYREVPQSEKETMDNHSFLLSLLSHPSDPPPPPLTNRGKALPVLQAEKRKREGKDVTIMSVLGNGRGHLASCNDCKKEWFSVFFA